jgi:hypothetical protein
MKDSREKAARALLAPLLFSFLCGCAPKSAPGPHLLSSRSVAYYLNAEANEVSEAAVRATFDNWSRQTPIAFACAGRNRAGIRRDGKNTVSFMSTWPKDLPQKTAYCRCWYDARGNTVEADIVLNCELARFTTKATNRPDSYYVEGVLSHEIGHMLGLEHADEAASIMKAFSPIDESWFKGEIDPRTLALLAELYPRNDRKLSAP